MKCFLLRSSFRALQQREVCRVTLPLFNPFSVLGEGRLEEANAVHSVLVI